MALNGFSPEDLQRLLEGNASCFTFRPLHLQQAMEAPSMPLLVNANELGPLPTGLPFISLADMPKMPSLPGLSGTMGAGALSLNLLDLPLFASLKDHVAQAAASAGHPSRHQLLTLPQLAHLPQLPIGRPEVRTVRNSQQPEEEESDEEDEDEYDDAGPGTSNPDRAGKSDAAEEGGRGRSKRSALHGSKNSIGQGGASAGAQGKGRFRPAASSSPSPPPSKRQQTTPGGVPPKRDRADRKRTLNREAQRRFRDRQKATMGELEEINAQQQTEINSLTLSNQILQQNYNALLENFKNLQSKVLQLQLRTGVVLV